MLKTAYYQRKMPEKALVKASLMKEKIRNGSRVWVIYFSPSCSHAEKHFDKDRYESFLEPKMLLPKKLDSHLHYEKCDNVEKSRSFFAIFLELLTHVLYTTHRGR